MLYNFKKQITKFLQQIHTDAILTCRGLLASAGEPVFCPRQGDQRLELREVPGYGIYNAKLRDVPGKLGVLGTLVLGEGTRLTHRTLKIF